MSRKIVKVYISKETKSLLEHIIKKIGLSESEIFIIAFIGYINKKRSLIDLLSELPNLKR